MSKSSDADIDRLNVHSSIPPKKWRFGWHLSWGLAIGIRFGPIGRFFTTGWPNTPGRYLTINLGPITLSWIRSHAYARR